MKKTAIFFGGDGILGCRQIKEDLAVFDDGGTVGVGQELLERTCKKLSPHVFAIGTNRNILVRELPHCQSHYRAHGFVRRCCRDRNGISARRRTLLSYHLRGGSTAATAT